MLKTAAATLFACVLATVVVRHGPLEPNGAGERVAITLVWSLGVLWVARMLVVAKRGAEP